jgi:MoaA/NifB/PqqE/SkfB family radical SAM enzyme
LIQGWGIVTTPQKQPFPDAPETSDRASQVFAVEGGDLIVREGDRLFLLADQRWMELDGVLACELDAVLRGQQPGSRLVALARSGLDGAEQVLEVAQRPRREVGRGGLLVEEPSILFLELTDSCPLSCRHCYAEASSARGEMLAPEMARDVIAQAAELGFARLQLTGGEPLGHPDVAELAAEAVAAGIPRVEVFTSGVALDRESLAAFPAETAFAVSVYSADPPIHDAITGVAGSLEATLAAIDLILARGSKLRVAVILMRDNAADWERTRDELKRRGVPERSIHASAVAAVGRGAGIEAPLERPASTVADVADPESARDPSAWPGKAAVSPTGEVFPCIFARWLSLGNVRRRPLGEILERPEPGAATGLPVRERWRYCCERLSCPDCRVLAFGMMGSGR